MLGPLCSVRSGIRPRAPADVTLCKHMRAFGCLYLHGLNQVFLNLQHRLYQARHRNDTSTHQRINAPTKTLLTLTETLSRVATTHFGFCDTHVGSLDLPWTYSLAGSSLAGCFCFCLGSCALNVSTLGKGISLTRLDKALSLARAAQDMCVSSYTDPIFVIAPLCNPDPTFRPRNRRPKSPLSKTATLNRRRCRRLRRSGNHA